MTKIVNLLSKPGTFLQLKSHPRITKKLQHFIHILQVRLNIFVEVNDVVQVYQACLPSDTRQDDIQGSLKGCRGIS